MTTDTGGTEPSRRDRMGPWLVAFLLIAVALLITWVLLSLFGGESAPEAGGLKPAAPPELAAAPPPASPATPPVTPPATPPATASTEPAEPELIDRFPLGQRQGHDPANDDRRSAFGEIGAHCFVGEECGDVPAGADAINEAAGGTAGIGSVGGGSGSGTGGIDIGGLFGGGGRGTSGSDGSGTTGGIASVGGGGGSSDTATRRDANRVPQGQVGTHCFVGEACPPIPDSSPTRDGSGTRTLSGPVVPCGERGVHSRVGQTQPCVNGVITRVGTNIETLPTGTTIGLEGRCYMVVERTTASATVVAIPCPTSTPVPVSG